MGPLPLHSLIAFPFLLGTTLRERRAAARRPTPSLLRRAPHPAQAAVPGRRARVLIVFPYTIYPPRHGGAVRLYNLIRRLHEQLDLYLLLLSGSSEEPEQRRELGPYCREIFVHKWRPQHRPDRFGLLPMAAQLFRDPRLAERLRAIVETRDIDIVQLDYTELGQYQGPFRRAKVVLVEHDIAFHSKARRRASGIHRRYPEGKEFGKSFLDWMRMFRYELAVCRTADQIHTMSEDDRVYLARHLPDGDRRIEVVPNAVDTDYYRPAGDLATRRDVLFVGSFPHLPNRDALDWFSESIWPRLRARHPGVRLTVVGANPPPAVLALAGRDGISVPGEVPDLRPYYQQHRVLAVPLRSGSGTRLKMVEAMASGLPVVSTMLGAEGIEHTPGEHLLIADSPADFALALDRVLCDDALAAGLSSASRRRALERYDWQGVCARVVAAYGALVAGSPQRAAPNRRGPRPGQPSRAAPDPTVSIVLPTFNGGPTLGRVLEAIERQAVPYGFEVVCVDSGSDGETMDILERHRVRVHSIDRAEFDHGLTRDLGASLARGRVLVFLNQDAVPGNDQWLRILTESLLPEHACAAVQGGIAEVMDRWQRFYWDSCGDRFYFTRESRRWISRYGVGFSTVNAAIRRKVWEQFPFGPAAIMEDKLWQRQVVEAGHHIFCRPDGFVYHTHNYDLRGLVRRCTGEGQGWRYLGEPYGLTSMVLDFLVPRVWADWLLGLARGGIRTGTELAFPLLRPALLYWGSRRRRWSQPQANGSQGRAGLPVRSRR